jgi:hypothetical protein
VGHGRPSDIVQDKSVDRCQNVVANIGVSDKAVTWLHRVAYENAV